MARIDRRRVAAIVVATAAFAAACSMPSPQRSVDVDVCVYGATSAGVIAAVQVARDGHSVALLDCDGHVGGMTTSGLGATDVGCDPAIGGLAREFYRSVRRRYDDDRSWVAETRERFRGRGLVAGSDVAWTFEPHVASEVFGAMLAAAGVVPASERLDRGGRGVDFADGRIRSIRTESGLTVRARLWLDCSYEGDLLAAAGCSHIVGREANAEFGEHHDGIQHASAVKHQFGAAVDPWRRPGDPASGLLPGIASEDPTPDGSADARVQAYCYRLCAAHAPAPRVPFPRPDGYDERDFELLLRWFDSGATMPPWDPVALPNCKTDSNNNGPVSMDGIGAASGWAEASYDERARLGAAQRRWQQGLLWTLAHHPRVPLSVRQHFAGYGLAADEFVANGHWPPLLYVREARRLRGDVVVSERHCTGELVADDPVGLGAYAMDSHNVRRLLRNGSVRNEGDVQLRVPRPYAIPFAALLPRRAECSNLLVPVCVSATHIAFGSIRMEPVFMLLAQSAAIAADLALDGESAVHDIDRAALHSRLLEAGQVLEPPAIHAIGDGTAAAGQAEGPGRSMLSR